MKSNFIAISKNRFILFASIVLVTFLLVIRDIYTVSVNKFLFVIITFLVAILTSRKYIFYLLCFFLPLSSGLPGNYIFLLILFALLFKDKRLNYEKVFVPLVLVIAEVFLSLLGYFLDFAELMGYCVNLFLTIYLIIDYYENEKRAYLNSLNFYILGVVLLLIIVFFVTLKNYSFVDLFSGNIRLGDYLYEIEVGDGFLLDSNNIGFYCILGSASCLFAFKNNHHKLLYLLSFLFIFVIGLTSVSRSFIIVVAIMIALYILFSLKPSFKNVFLISLTLFAFSFSVLYLYNYTSIFDGYKMRFSLDTTVSAGGRIDIMKEYFIWQVNRPLRFIFGTGALNYRQICELPVSLHNGTQQLFLSYGVVGFFFLLVVILKSIQRVVKKNNCNFIMFLPFVSFFLYVQTVQLLNPIYYFMSIIICFCSIKSKNVFNGTKFFYLVKYKK